MTCRGVPERAHLNLESSANTALAVEQRRSLMEWAAHTKTSESNSCRSPISRVTEATQGATLVRKMSMSAAFSRCYSLVKLKVVYIN